MKYSIKGSTFISDGTEIIITINKYKIWKLLQSNGKSLITDDDIFDFEVWVNAQEDKDMLFNDLKTFINSYGGNINWHECKHDEDSNEPCVIKESYRGE